MKLGSTNCVEILSPAKVNLFLEIHSKRADGFHGLETVMAAVDLRDHLRFYQRADDQINLRIVNPISSPSLESIPTDDGNLIIQALRLLQKSNLDNARAPRGCDVLLLKRIPSEAGLGGASSNAAAALMAGNSLWNLGLGREQLSLLGSQIGSDVPFFIYGGAAVCSGRGEIINPIRSSSGIPIVIAKPRTGLSTAKVFAQCQVATSAQSSLPIVSSLENGRFSELASLFFNRLEEVARTMNEDIKELSIAFREINCPGHQMSGSGTSYFGVFPSSRVARRAARVLSNRLPHAKIFVSRTLSPYCTTAA